MKGCFLLQRGFAPVGHAMAMIFKKKYGIEQHCALTSLWKNYEFLSNQKDIIYTSILLDENIHAQYKNEALDLKYLQWLEKEYGIPNLWPYLTVDRILLHGQFLRMYPYDKSPYSHEDLLRILQVTSKKIINFLDDEKPSFVFFANIGSLAPFLLYELSRKRGIPTFIGEFSRFKNKFTVTEDLPNYSLMRERFTKIKNGEIRPIQQAIHQAKSLIESQIDHPVVYDEAATPERQPLSRRKQIRFLLPLNLYQSFRWFIKTLTSYYGQRSDYMQINPWFYLIDRLRKKTRVLRGYEDLYDAVDAKEDFAYFSLSLEPELTLLFYSPFATDQIGVIKQLAKALPVHYKLYVKEHPMMAGYRTRRFYKELKKMPNVKLINPSIKSFDIIKKAKLVATISGTAGWEAILFRKPCITFGEAFYNPLSMVKYCRSFHELPYLVKSQLEDFRYDQQELINFVVALLEDTASVDMLNLWEQERDLQKICRGVEPLVDLVAKKLNLRPIDV